MGHFPCGVGSRSWLAPALVWVSITGLLAVSGCGFLGLYQSDCTAPQVPAASEPLSPIRLALHYLQHTQLTADQLDPHRVDYAGNWPQCFALRPGGPFIRDTSPFMATFIHHALTLITEQHQEPLGLTDLDIEKARTMRRAAIALMLRFQAEPESPQAGTFGFWPPQSSAWLPGDLLLSGIGSFVGQGPQFMGVRAPINLSFYPEAFAIPTDADDTALVYAALLDHARLDGGPEVTENFERFFSDWRDLGQAPRHNDVPWLPADSEAYLTWLNYGDDPAHPKPNDVDIIVNANVLYSLGRYGRLDTAGVAQAVAIINAAIESGAHRSGPNEISLHYPDNLVLHYSVTRAYQQGGVLDLAPAVELLREDLLGSVETGDAGHCCWDRGEPHLNTALGVLALLAAGYRGEVTDRATDYLISQQDPDSGSWEAGAFFRGRLDGGVEAIWVCQAQATAMALEALCQQRLACLEVNTAQTR